MTIDVVARRVLADLTIGLDPIGLDELEQTAALLDRVDRKYLVRAGQLPEIVAAVATPMRVLEIHDVRAFEYRSTYFDTPDLISYHQAARRRPRRFKVRTRRYDSTGTCWIEAKLRDRHGRTVKERLEHDPSDEMTLTPTARTFLAGFDTIDEHVGTLAPSLTTEYQRATLSCGQRVTLDVDLTYRHPGGAQLATFGVDDDVMIVETKSATRQPGPFDRALWASGVRPAVVSKYGIGIAAAHPELPANKWHRVVTRHLEPATFDTSTERPRPNAARPATCYPPTPTGDLR